MFDYHRGSSSGGLNEVNRVMMVYTYWRSSTIQRFVIQCAIFKGSVLTKYSLKTLKFIVESKRNKLQVHHFVASYGFPINSILE